MPIFCLCWFTYKNKSNESYTKVDYSQFEESFLFKHTRKGYRLVRQITVVCVVKNEPFFNCKEVLDQER